MTPKRKTKIAIEITILQLMLDWELNRDELASAIYGELDIDNVHIDWVGRGNR